MVNKLPTLQLANGKKVNFMTQYDTKTLLFTIDKSDRGQEITGLASGAIESMHNLPVSLEGAGIPGATNGSEAAVHEVPEFTGGVNGVEAAVHEVPEFEGGVNGEEAAVTELPEYTEAIGTVGEEAAPIVELPEFTGGVNGSEAAVHEVPEFTGGVSADSPVTPENPEFVGGVNGLEPAVHEVPAFTGSVKNDVAPTENPGFTAGTKGSEGTGHKDPDHKGQQSIVSQAMSQDKTYQAPAAPAVRQDVLPKTGNEDASALASVGVVGMLLGMFALGKRKED